MLKLTYTETGLHMEQVSTPLEVLLTQRVVLALRTEQSLYVEPGKASFLIVATDPQLTYLESLLRQEGNLTIVPVDESYVEISLEGNWVARTAETHEGMFVTSLSIKVEFFLYRLWQVSQSEPSFLR